MRSSRRVQGRQSYFQLASNTRYCLPIRPLTTCVQKASSGSCRRSHCHCLFVSSAMNSRYLHMQHHSAHQGQASLHVPRDTASKY
jgi:hypothetical protein